MTDELLRYAPLTSLVGFLSAPLEEVADAYEAWSGSVLREYGATLTRKQVSVDAESFPRLLEPLTVPVAVRFLFVHVNNGWTAYFDNFRGGPDQSRPEVLAEKLRCKCIIAAWVPNTMPRRASRETKGHYGHTRFSYYGFDEGVRRTVEVINDGGRWDFDTIGTPLLFERTEPYTAKRVQDRFTPQLLDEYAAHYGIDYFRLSFYFPGQGVLFTRHGGLKADLKEFTLEEHQASYR
jgi:hypothetical protein